ncbi:MAG: hypothetical protein AAF648_08755 [Pseudomonadota bacterium]
MNFSHYTNRIFTAAFLVGTLLSTGCTNLANNLQDPAVWNRIAEINERYDRRMAETRRNRYERVERERQQRVERRTPEFNAAGRWTHSPKTVIGFNTTYVTAKTNFISYGNGGIYAQAKGGKARYFYNKVGPNLYRSSKGQTYRFTSANTAVWSGPGQKSITLKRAR